MKVYYISSSTIPSRLANSIHVVNMSEGLTQLGHEVILFANFGEAPAEIAYQYVNKLRSIDVACELYPTEVKLKKQLAYANDKKISKVILIGSEELEQNKFVIKDMDTSVQTSHPITELLSLLS